MAPALAAYTSLTAQMINDLINGAGLQFCLSCGRLLYLPEPEIANTRRMRRRSASHRRLTSRDRVTRIARTRSHAMTCPRLAGRPVPARDSHRLTQSRATI